MNIAGEKNEANKQMHSCERANIPDSRGIDILYVSLQYTKTAVGAIFLQEEKKLPCQHPE